MSIVPVIASYLIGSINFAYIVAKFKNINIQEIGSGNPGSSNVLRALGKKYAIIVLVGDLFKGIAPFLIFGGELETLIYASLAVIGHCFPIFYGFKGGKGVATYLGTVIGYYLSCTRFRVFILGNYPNFWIYRTLVWNILHF